MKLLPLKRVVLLSVYLLCYVSTTEAQCPTLKDSICRCKDSVPPPQYLRNSSFEELTPEPCLGSTEFDYNHYPYYWTYGVDFKPRFFVLDCPYNGYFFNGTMKSFPPPLPIPDGKVVIAFADDPGTKNGFKAYTATCLANTLQANTKYTFEFYLGFSPADIEGSVFTTPYEVVIYGNPSCDSIPFGYRGDLGCPTNIDAYGGGYVTHGWIKLGSVYVNGGGEWVKARIDFVPPENINGFIFGPNCERVGGLPDTRIDHSHYADNFSLTETSQLKFRNISADSGACSNGIVLHAPPAINVKAYQWYKDSIAIAGAADSVYQVAASTNASGNYQVRITFSNTCLLSDPLNVDLSLFNLNLGKDSTLCYGQSLSIKPKIKNVNYLWQDGSTSDSFLIQQPGIYSLKLTNAYGCSVTKTIKVDFLQCSQCKLFIPNAFTPNADGTNDVFSVKSSCGQVNNYNLKIYNRWGKNVFKTSNILQGWDGTFKTEPQPVGTYIYFISYRQYGVAGLQQKKGVVTLLR